MKIAYSKSLAITFLLSVTGFTGNSQNQQKTDSGFALNENELNDYGYTLLKDEKQTEALKIFKLNVDLNPKSANANDSYAETLAGLGNKKEAIKYYQYAFELNPKNMNAQEQINKLKKL